MRPLRVAWILLVCISSVMCTPVPESSMDIDNHAVQGGSEASLGTVSQLRLAARSSSTVLYSVHIVSYTEGAFLPAIVFVKPTQQAWAFMSVFDKGSGSWQVLKQKRTRTELGKEGSFLNSDVSKIQVEVGFLSDSQGQTMSKFTASSLVPAGNNRDCWTYLRNALKLMVELMVGEKEKVERDVHWAYDLLLRQAHKKGMKTEQGCSYDWSRGSVSLAEDSKIISPVVDGAGSRRRGWLRPLVG